MIGQSTRQVPMFWLALAASAGIGMASQWPFTGNWLVVSALAVLLCLVPALRSVSLLFATFLIFGTYSLARIESIPSDDLRKQLSDGNVEAVLEGRLVSSPRLHIYDSYQLFELRLGVEQMNHQQARGTVLLRTKAPLSQDLKYGDQIRVSCLLGKPLPPLNPGQFDLRRYLERQGIYFTASPAAEDITLIESRPPPLLQQASLALREQMSRALALPPPDGWTTRTREAFPLLLSQAPNEQIRILMTGMLFGFTDGLDDSLNDDFRKTGTLHLFAVSGQNVAVITALLIFVLQALGLVKWRWAWIVVPAVLIFCMAAGMAASAMRALLMVSLGYLGWALGRRVDPLNIVGLAALLLYLFEPRDFFSVGFQLSFIIVVGLLLIADPLQKWLEDPLAPDPFIPRILLAPWRDRAWKASKIVCGVAGVCLAAWLSSAPLSLYYFHSFTPITPVANILVTPLAAAIMLFSAGSALIAWLAPSVAMILNFGNWICLQLLVAIVSTLAHVPGGNCVISLDARAWSSASTVTIFSAEGACPIFLKQGNQSVLISTGTPQHYKRIVRPTLELHGLSAPTGLIFPEGVKSSLGGAQDLLESGRPDWIAMTGIKNSSTYYKQLLQALERSPIPLHIWRQMHTEKVSPTFTLEVLWPPEKETTSGGGENSLVLLLHSGSFSILYANAISAVVEKKIIESNDLHEIDLLIQAPSRHGDNLSAEWMGKLHPRILIEPAAGYNSRGELPSEEWLAPDLPQAPRLIQLAESGGLEITIEENILKIHALGTDDFQLLPSRSILKTSERK